VEFPEIRWPPRRPACMPLIECRNFLMLHRLKLFAPSTREVVRSGARFARTLYRVEWSEFDSVHRLLLTQNCCS
jgi:hypothetical protein